MVANSTNKLLEIEDEQESIDRSLGDVIEMLQKILGVRNKDLISYGISSSQLSQIKAGNKSLSIEKLFKLSEGLDVPVSTILKFVEDKRRNKFSKVVLMEKMCQKIEELETQEAKLTEKLNHLSAK